MFDTLTTSELAERHTDLYHQLTAMHAGLRGRPVFSAEYGVLNAKLTELKQTFDAMSDELNRRFICEDMAADA